MQIAEEVGVSITGNSVVVEVEVVFWGPERVVLGAAFVILVARVVLVGVLVVDHQHQLQ